jgi:hypothetical protein
MKRIFLTFFILVSLLSSAQEYKTDFKKSVAFYKNAKNLSMTVSVTSFDNAKDKSGTSLGTGKMYRSEKKYYSNFMNAEIIDDGTKVLMIDHNGKRVSLFPDHSMITNIPVMDKEMDSLLKSSDSVVYVGKKDGGIQYTCHGKSEDLIQKYNITLDAKDYHVVKIEYFYNQKNKDFEIEQYKQIVTYTSVSTQKLTDVEKFKMDSHVSVKEGEYVLNGKYKGYKLRVMDKKKVVNKYIKG